MRGFWPYSDVILGWRHYSNWPCVCHDAPRQQHRVCLAVPRSGGFLQGHKRPFRSGRPLSAFVGKRLPGQWNSWRTILFPASAANSCLCSSTRTATRLKSFIGNGPGFACGRSGWSRNASNGRIISRAICWCWTGSSSTGCSTARPKPPCVRIGRYLIAQFCK